jgi:choline dehydrogenase-like flavoprotein
MTTKAAIETEVLIIGAGASGAVAANYLARQGIRVVCLEQGDWPDESKYVGRRPEHEIVVNPRWHANPNVRLQRQDYPVDISECDVDISMYNGVGGGTILWTAFWHRMLPSDFRVKTLDNVAADWPISYRDIADDYEEVEHDMGVSGLAGDPAYPPRNPYPLPAFPLERAGVKFGEAMNRLRWHWWPGTNAIPSRQWNSLNACVRRGVCGMACADGAKATLDKTHWPGAIAAGARLITGARVKEVTVNERGLATGAVYIDTSGIEQVVKADVVILCANGIGTSRLLLLSKSRRFPNGLANSSGRVGRGLMLHPTGLVVGIMDEKMETWHGPRGQIANSMEFYESESSRGFVRGSKWSLVSSGGPLGFALGLGLSGEQHQQAMLNTFGRTMPILTFAEDLPEEHNRVELDETLTDSDDIPAPKIVYKVGENTRRILEFNIDKAAQALREAGAVETIKTAINREFGGAHLMGTARMGVDPSASVVNEWGRTHDVENLYIADASVFVTGGAVNPTATICALALRFAKQLAQGRRFQKVAL